METAAAAGRRRELPGPERCEPGQARAFKFKSLHDRTGGSPRVCSR
jgi:hypothetical protein